MAIIEATMPDRPRVAVVIAAWGTLRYGELTELRRGDVIDRDGQIFVRVERAVTRRLPGRVNVHEVVVPSPRRCRS